MRGAQRLVTVLGAVALTVALATACMPDPAPSPTPTGFASEEEAFAAAEATYRAYVDAVNEVVLADPGTFEDVYEHLTGDALNAAKKSFTQMHADGWIVGGDSTVQLVEASSKEGGSIALAICLDVSGVTLTNSAGESQVGDRPNTQSLQAIVVSGGGEWLISSFSGRDGEPTCTP